MRTGVYGPAPIMSHSDLTCLLENAFDEIRADSLFRWSGNGRRPMGPTCLRHGRTRFGLLLIMALSSAGACHRRPGVDTSPVLTLQPARVLGAGSRANASFGRIDAFTADSAGTLYVADRYAHEIRAYTPDGRLLWSSGRSGHGPGDVGEISYLAISGHRLYSFDKALWRLTIRDRRTGSVEATIPTPMYNHGLLTNGAPMRVSGDSLATFGALTLLDEPNPLDARITKVIEHLIRWNLRTGTADTLDIPYKPMRELVYPRGNGVFGRGAIPFTPMQVYVPNPQGGFTTAWGGDYRITVVGPHGDTVAVAGRDVPARRPSPIAGERAKKDVTRQLRYGHAKPGFTVKIPDAYPEILAMSYSRDGRQLWVRRTYYEDGQVFDVLLDGEYRCTVRLDPGRFLGISLFQPVRVVNNRAYEYATTRDTDLPLILTYDLRKSEGASCF